MTAWKIAIAALIFLSGTIGNACAQSQANFNAVLRQIGPALHADKKVGRIYYRSTSCDLNPSGADPAPFPQVNVQPPQKNTSGLTAIQSIFRGAKNVTVTEHPSGIVRIRIGRVPDAILQTRISGLPLTTTAQYNVYPAIDAILWSQKMQAAMRRLGISTLPRLYMMLMQQPMKGLPHLPRMMRNITVEGALDAVAKTFNGIVLYGVCKHPTTFGVLFSPLFVPSDLEKGAGNIPNAH